jgi:hypothetical protein
MINGTRKLRFHVKAFCTDSISILKEKHISVIWALKSMEGQNVGKVEDKVSTIELLKTLTTQAVRINTALHTDAALTPRLQAYLAASTESDWLKILL